MTKQLEKLLQELTELGEIHVVGVDSLEDVASVGDLLEMIHEQQLHYGLEEEAAPLCESEVDVALTKLSQAAKRAMEGFGGKSVIPSPKYAAYCHTKAAPIPLPSLVSSEEEAVMYMESKGYTHFEVYLKLGTYKVETKTELVKQ